MGNCGTQLRRGRRASQTSTAFRTTKPWIARSVSGIASLHTVELLSVTGPPSMTPRDYIKQARILAADRCFTQGRVSADDLRDELGPPPTVNVTGAVFGGGYFKELRRVPSKFPENHGRRIGVYALSLAGRRAFKWMEP